MALIKCPECKKKVSNLCENCPKCGYPIKAHFSKEDTEDSEPVSKNKTINNSDSKEKKPLNKQLLIVIIAVAFAVFIVGGIVAYNAFLPWINATRDFKAAVAAVEAKNAQLDDAIKECEDLINKKHPLLDESLIPALEMAISDAKAVKELDFKIPDSIEGIIKRTEELEKTDYSVALTNICEKCEAVTVNARRYQLVNHPTEAYIIQCLKTIPEIVNISAVTEDNDPNGQLNKPGGYTATVYFAHAKIDLDKSIYGVTLIEQGTDAGGGIEVYTCVEDAVKRRDYLASFDGGVFANGTHTVIGTVLVRTSNELTATQQRDFEGKLIAALTFLPEVDQKESELPKENVPAIEPPKQDETNQEPPEETKPETGKPSTDLPTTNNDSTPKCKLTLSKTNLTVQNETEIIATVTVDETDFPEGISLIATVDNGIVEIEWGEWNGWSVSMKIIPVETGYCTIKVYVEEFPSAIKTITVNVEALPDTGDDKIEQLQLAYDAAEGLLQNNQDRIISVYELYEYLLGLGFSESVCEEVCFDRPPEGFDDGSVMYDYERINKFSNYGYSREAIIDFYLDRLSYEDAAFLVDECLSGRKLTYEYVDGSLELVEH